MWVSHGWKEEYFIEQWSTMTGVFLTAAARQFNLITNMSDNRILDDPAMQ